MHFCSGFLSHIAILMLFMNGFVCAAAGQKAGDISAQERAHAVVSDYIKNCDFDKALELAAYYREKAVSDPKAVAAWLITESAVLLKQGNHEAVKRKLDEAEKMMTSMKDPGQMLQFDRALQKGSYLNFMGKNKESLLWLRRAETLIGWVRTRDPKRAANLCSQIGTTLFWMENYSASAEYYQRAIDLSAGSNDPVNMILLKARMADVCSLLPGDSRYEELVRSCVRSLDTAENPLHPGLLEAYLLLSGFRLNDLDNYAITVNILRNATLIAEKYYPPEHFLTGMLYTLKAQDEYHHSNYEKALQYSRHALQIISGFSLLNRYVLSNYGTISQVYFWLERDYEKTIAFSRQAISDLQGTGQSPAFFYYMMGVSCNMLHNEVQARDYLNKVISLTSENRKYENDHYCSIAYYELGRMNLIANNHALCRYYLLKSLSYANKRSADNARIIYIYKDLGNSYNYTGDQRLALNYIQQAIIAGCNTFCDTSVYADPKVEDIVLNQQVTECLTLKAYTFYMIYEKDKRRLDQLVSALKCQELAVRLIERKVIDIDDEKSGLIVADLRKYSMDNAVSYAVLLYLQTGDVQYAHKAWMYAEKSKMQVLSLNSMKNNNLLFSGLPDSLVDKHEQLRHDVLQTENMLAFAEKDPGWQHIQQKELEKLTSLYNRLDELTAQLESNYPAYSRVKYNFTVAGIEQVQRFLEQDQVILEYQLLNTELITFVISPDDFSIHYQLIDKKLRDDIAKVRSAITSNPFRTDPAVSFREFTESSFNLYTRLIEPVRDRISNKRLIIIPHNLLTSVPFEVLIRKKPANNSKYDFKTLDYLIREFPIDYAYSANLLIDNRRFRKSGLGTGVFLPDYNSYKGKKDRERFPVLEGAATEASVVKKLMRGKLYRGKWATETTFKACASRHKILHIASHTILDEKDPGLSCLVMSAPADSADDGCLYSFEIMQMDLNAQLVVLSGCNTGYGMLRNSEGLISIARSFFYTGVRTVAFTLWQVADQAGSALISDFYKEIRHRKSLDLAMRTAKLRYLDRADPVMAHPFYWAGYVLIGKTDSLAIRRTFLWIIIFGVPLATIFIIYYYRKIRD
jgi:CHAT domain-containing protein